MYRDYGWSKRGKPIISKISGKRFIRESFIAGYIENKVIAPLCYQGICNTSLFNIWLQKSLLPCLSPGHVIVMDNATFHKSKTTIKLILQSGCKVLFLPPYSPDLNPIEKFWANLKKKIRNVAAKFSTLQQAIDYAFNM